jgi:hypothetical protein
VELTFVEPRFTVEDNGRNISMFRKKRREYFKCHTVTSTKQEKE